MVLKFVLTLFLVLFVSPAPANDSNGVRKSLGGYPLCEASAAIVMDCPEKKDGGKKKRCLLVGDNETNDRLFLFNIKEKSQDPVLDERREIYLGMRSENEGFEISDIEALTTLGSDKAVVFGSHSRSSKCEKKKKRHRFAESKLLAARLGGKSGRPVKATEFKCGELFEGMQSELAEGLCKKIVDAEEKAQAIDDSADSGSSEFFDPRVACSILPTFNLEGAAAVKAPDGEVRIWVGLRSPLIDGMAVLLRKVKKDKFAFDAIVLVRLSGHGIRDLAFKSEYLWGIAGPSSDSDNEHWLWRIEASDLENNAVLTPREFGVLPSYSEGLAIMDDKAFVLIDGSDPEDKSPMVCRTPSEYIVLDLNK